MDGNKQVSLGIDFLGAGNGLVLEVGLLHVLEHAELPVKLLLDADEVEAAAELALGDGVLVLVDASLAQVEDVHLLLKLGAEDDLVGVAVQELDEAFLLA